MLGSASELAGWLAGRMGTSLLGRPCCCDLWLSKYLLPLCPNYLLAHKSFYPWAAFGALINFLQLPPAIGACEFDTESDFLGLRVGLGDLFDMPDSDLAHNSHNWSTSQRGFTHPPFRGRPINPPSGDLSGRALWVMCLFFSFF